MIKTTLAALLLTAALFSGGEGAWAQSSATPGSGSAATVPGPRTQAPSTPSASAGSRTSAGTSSRGATSSKLDVNTASAQDLAALPGMTPAYAQAVVAGRPYARKTQLVRKKIVPQAVYDQISSQIIAHRVKK